MWHALTEDLHRINTVSMCLWRLPPNYTFISLQHCLCTAVLKIDVLTAVEVTVLYSNETAQVRWKQKEKFEQGKIWTSCVESSAWSWTFFSFYFSSQEYSLLLVLLSDISLISPSPAHYFLHWMLAMDINHAHHLDIIHSHLHTYFHWGGGALDMCMCVNAYMHAHIDV